jgi:hypothetical protein
MYVAVYRYQITIHRASHLFLSHCSPRAPYVIGSKEFPSRIHLSAVNKYPSIYSPLWINILDAAQSFFRVPKDESEQASERGHCLFVFWRCALCSVGGIHHLGPQIHHTHLALSPECLRNKCSRAWLAEDLKSILVTVALVRLAFWSLSLINTYTSANKSNP